jgi:glutamate--cysteine ligase
VSLDRQGVPERPIESVEDLVGYLREGEKPPERWRVGTEHEKIGLYAEGLTPVPYEGERGIGCLLADVAERGGWKTVLEAGRVVALVGDGASISLEPGGQLELSGAPLRTIHDTCREFHHHLELVRAASEPLGILWLSLGMNPLSEVADVPRMPRVRHDIMRSYLPAHGELALEMMHLTATVQANFDYESEADMVAKLRTALGVSPVVSAIFANSSLAAGKPSGYVSRRVHIWRHTDPDRCGIPSFVFAEGFGYRQWIEWALDVPMFFVVRDGLYRPMHGKPFRAFLQEGHEGERAHIADFDRHLTTLFPEVRLKRVIEVRGADAVPPGLICALPALWKGILYDAEARDAVWQLVGGWTQEEREAGLDAVARRGLGAEIAGRSALALAREVLALAEAGLRRIGHAGVLDPDERCYLVPIAEQLALGKSPGEIVIERWEGEWRRSPQRLIEYARY